MVRFRPLRLTVCPEVRLIVNSISVPNLKRSNMILRNWLEGLFTRRPARRFSKTRVPNWQGNSGVETLEMRRLLTDPAFGYALDLGGPDTQKITSTVVDSEGNVYVGGCFSKTVDFDPSSNVSTLTAVNFRDGFLAKYDKNGNFQWVNQLPAVTGYIFSDSSSYVALNQLQGGVYITGNLQGTFDFDPGVKNVSATGSGAAYIASYDSDGSARWAKALDGMATVAPNAITSDHQGNVYTTGYLSVGTADMDPGPGTYNLTNSTNPSHANTYISKLDVNGDFVWADQFVDLNTDLGVSGSYALAVDDSQNVYVTGFIEGPMDFDPDPVNTDIRPGNGPLDDGYLVKLTSSGALGYVVTFGGHDSDNDLMYGLTTDAAGNAYVAGSFSYKTTIDTPAGSTEVTSTDNTYSDLLVAKFDSSGGLTWAKDFASDRSQVGSSIAYNESGMLYVGGYFEGTFDVDPANGLSLVSNGKADAFAMRLDTDGNLNWAVSWGGTEDDLLNGIAVDGYGDVFTVGTFSGTADFDPFASTSNLTSQGADDGFISKLTQPLTRPIVANDAYSIPAGGHLNVFAPGVLANDTSPSGNPLKSGFFKRLTSANQVGLGISDDGSLTFNPNSFTGVFQLQYQAIDGGTYSDPAIVNIYVGVNGSPNLNPAGDPVLAAINENVAPESNPGTLVSDIIASMAPKGGITDPDSGALQGLAITGANQTHGTWQFSTDNGGNWTDFGATSANNSLLLASDANTRVRFLPKTDFSGTAAFCCLAWDQTDGSANGSWTAVTAYGSTSSFSHSRDYPTITINALHKAPKLVRTGNLPKLDPINEDELDSNNPGTLVSDVLNRMMNQGGSITGPSGGAGPGIAVIGANQAAGTWQFSIDGGSNWSNFGTTGLANALFLSPDANTRIRFQPKRDFNGEARFTFIAWDQSDGIANGTAHAITLAGGASACSIGRQDAQIIVNAQNDAPRLNRNGDPYVTSIPQNLDDASNNGTLVSDIIARMAPNGGITDVDLSGGAVGIAIIGADASHGTWQFTIDGGSDWTDFGSVNLGNSILLNGDANTRIRFKPNQDFTGNAGMTFIGWDETDGVAGTFQPITAAGGTTAFSTGRDTAFISVT